MLACDVWVRVYVVRVYWIFASVVPMLMFILFLFDFSNIHTERNEIHGRRWQKFGGFFSVIYDGFLMCVCVYLNIFSYFSSVPSASLLSIWKTLKIIRFDLFSNRLLIICSRFISFIHLPPEISFPRICLFWRHFRLIGCGNIFGCYSTLSYHSSQFLLQFYLIPEHRHDPKKQSLIHKSFSPAHRQLITRSVFDFLLFR